MAVPSRKLNGPIGSMIAMIGLSISAVHAQTPSSEPASMDGWPDWLVEAMGREATGIKDQPVELDTRGFSTILPGTSLSEPEFVDIGWYVTAGVGTETPMECWVFTSPIDAATSVNNFADLSMETLAQNYGGLADNFLHYIDSGAIGNAPYLALEKVYTMGPEGERVIGFVKVRIASLDGLHLGCIHNEVGFRETFARGFEKFVRNASFEPQAEQPFLREIMRQSVDGQPIGYIEVTYAIDEDGDYVVTTRDSTLSPVDSSTISASDGVAIGIWSPEGDLILERSVMSSGGELSMNLDLVPGEAGIYKVTGQMQGKNIELDIESDVAPMSDIELLLETQRLMADPDRNSLTAVAWEPSADPTRFLPGTLTLDSKEGPDVRGTLTMGPMSMSVRLDEFGSMHFASISIGASTMQMERVHMSGKPIMLDSE